VTTQARCRIGIDVGGTFTDFVMADMSNGRFHYHKEPSVPSDPSRAVEQGIAALVKAAGVPYSAVELVVHGTTIGLNAIIQRRGARVALVVSPGNRDVMDLARSRMPNSYDFTAPRETPLVPRDLVIEVPARMRADGAVVREPTAGELAALVGELKVRKVDAVAVMLLNSYRDRSLEAGLAVALRAALPGTLVTESAELWPEVREYERALVAALNAYIHPLMESYFERLRTRLSALGLAAPIYITANNGGTLGLDTARRRPIDTILSGPASGVVAAARVAAPGNRTKLITIDMGGTSTDIAVCVAGEPEFTTATNVGDFPLMLPVVNVGAIGAGGGSILWVDAQGVLKVGPESAGADPGPVCYGRGATRPTITDCYLVVGILDPTRFLGGRMTLDRAAAERALDAVAAKLGLEGPDRALRAAASALRVATSKMATETSKLMARRGLDPREFALLAYGGAGPTQANLLAEEALLPEVVVPLAPGTFCALGAILADVRRDYLRATRTTVGRDAAQMEALMATVTEVEREALDWVGKEGEIIGEHRLELAFDMRYPAQAYDLRIAVPEAARAGLDAETLAALFHAEHERHYGFADAGSAVQIKNLRVRVTGRVARLTLASPPETPAALPRARRRIYDRTQWVDADVYDRTQLGLGTRIRGPAVVEQADTTTWILPGWEAVADPVGNLILTRAK
jgi:N-methylhydantoinase A